MVSYPKNELFWKENRAYFISQTHRVEDENLYVDGYVKSNKLSANRVIHITGYGDFRINQIGVTVEKKGQSS